MSAITIDERSALVLIDLQKGILALPTLLSQDDIKNRARRLAAAFRASALPVVRVKLAFSADGGDLPPGRALIPGPQSAPPAAYSEFPEDFPPHPGDIILVKRNWGTFTGTELDLQLRRRGMTQIVLAGISTGMGVESTARSAREHSYNVIFAEDAITDVDAASQTHAFIKIFPQLGEIATTQQIIDTLEGRSVGLEVGPAAGGSITHISEGAKMPVYDAAHVPDTVGRGTLDPELEAWLPSGPTLGADVPVAQGRRDHMQLGVGPWPSVGAVGTLVLPGPHGSVTVRRHTPSAPASSPSGGLVYIHGGGFTYGTLDEFEVPMRLIAERAGIVTYIVEYQLAPEAKYPVQIEEIEYVVRWLFGNAAAQGIDPAKIGVGGDSAGGNMTCVIALKLRDENGPRLAVQVPLFPEAAFPADTLAASENRSGLYLESNGIFEMVRNLVKNTDDVRHPYITPLNAGSHAGLPPAILVTNGFDPLRDVGHAYARKLAAAGNDLTYIHNPNLTHGFPQFTRSSTACHQATLELADLIKTKIG